MDKCPAGTQGGACRERELHPEIGAVRLGRHHEGAGGSGTLPAPVRLYYLSGLFDRVLYLKDGEIDGDYTAEEFCGLSAKQRDDMGLRPLDLAGLSEIEGPPQRMNEAVWTIKNVSFAYKHEPETLHITETSFPSGSATAIIGHNGAGKSTFARCLCGLEKHFKGTVQDQSKNYSRKERLKLCYMVMQDVNHQLFTESVLDEILLSMRTEDKQRAREILQEMDLLPYEDCHPMGLSGGQKQRVALAGVLAMEPRVLILDEASSMLDPRGRKGLMKACRALHARGMTIVMITHFMEEAAVADRVVVLDKGKIALDGTPAEVFSQVQKVKALGLDVPPMAELAMRLRAGGLSLPDGILTVADMVKELKKALCPSK